MDKPIRLISTLLLLLLTLSIFSCKKTDDGPMIVVDDKDPDPDDDEPTDFVTITFDINEQYQEMIGFGGALTWYCDRITSSSKKDEMGDLLFDDLGLDILRLKNWYYPQGYPSVKSTAAMEVSWFKQHYDATIELNDMAKSINPDIKVLLSSWGPPSALKSNDALNEGTLKKEEGEFIYDQFAQYWVDVLDNTGFDPDYISMQNEPSYTNPGWETCEWRPTETSSFPGYAEALQLIYDNIKDRPYVPKIMGPESANLGNSSFGGNTFATFADAIKDKDYIDSYAYHPYNFTNNTDIQDTFSALEMISNNYNDRQNIMTEYSGMSWLKTAHFINSVITKANASAYIYWSMMWEENEDDAMMKVTSSGNYELTPFYYVIKHFAKHIDLGHIRVGALSDQDDISTSAFISPDGNKLTLILINTANSDHQILIDEEGSVASANRTVGNSFFTDVDIVKLGESFELPGRSIITIVLDI